MGVLEFISWQKQLITMALGHGGYCKDDSALATMHATILFTLSSYKAVD